MLLESDPANRIRGILVTRTIPGRGGLWLFGHKAIHPYLSSSPKNTMLSRLSALKAALKPVGTATRTPFLSNSTVRIQARLDLLPNPHSHISLGPVPLVQRRSSGPSGPCFPLFIPFLCLKPPISPRLPPVPRWFPPAYLPLVRLPGIPIFTGRSLSSAKFTRILPPKMACTLLHTHGHTTDCSTLSIIPGTSPRSPSFFPPF